MAKARITALIAELAGDPHTEHARAARTEARSRAPAHPELRRALAEHYRRLGDPAQAGRWGVVFPGWAKPYEIVRLRRVLLSTADGGNFVRRYLGLRAQTPLPPEVRDLVAPSFTERAPRGDGGRVLLGCGGALVAVVSTAMLALGTMAVLWRGLVGAPLEGDLVAFGVAAASLAVGVCTAFLAWRGPSSDDKATHSDFAVRRALELLRECPAEGRVMLRALARTIDDPSVRPALVDDARRRGRPVDAGRWGCPQAGLTTPEEREAYATALRGKTGPVTFDRVMDLSAAWGENPSPGDIADVLRRTGITVPLPPEAVEETPPLGGWWAVPPLALPAGAVAAVLVPACAHIISAGALSTTAAGWAIVCVVTAAVRTRPTHVRLTYATYAAVLGAAATGFALAAS